ncbi:MAG: O-antigen ligase family protein [Thermoleophilia bacterium]
MTALETRWETRNIFLPWLAPACAMAVFLYLSIFDGGYFSREIYLAGTGMWAVLGLALLLNWDWVRMPDGAAAPAASLAAVSGWILLTMIWSISPNASLIEFGRAALYLGVFIAILIGPPGRKAVIWTASLFVGMVTGLAMFALLAKINPSISVDYLYAGGRIMGTIGYWNGLAALVAVTILPALWLAASEWVSWTGRMAATLALAILGLTLFFTLSRGGLLVGAVGVALYLMLAPERLGGILSLLSAFVPGGLMAWYASTALPSLQTKAAGGRIGDGDGQHFAFALIMALTATIVLKAATLLLPSRVPRTRNGMIATGAAALIGLVLVAGVGVAERQRIENRIRGAQSQTAVQVYDYSRSSIDKQGVARLASTSNNRAEYWSIGLTNFRDHPLLGTGAGTYQFADARLRSVNGLARDPHSIWVRFLSDQGVIGFLLLLAFLGSLGWVVFRQVRKNHGLLTDGLYIALIVGCLAWLADATFEWDWELPAVGFSFFLLAALVIRLGSAGEPDARQQAESAATAGRLPRKQIIPGIRMLTGQVKTAMVLLSMTLTIVFLVLLFAQVENQRASHLLSAGDPAGAAAAAHTAHRLNYSDGGPLLILAEASQQEGDFFAARDYYQSALDRDPQRSAYQEGLALLEFYDLKLTGQGLTDLNKAVNLDPQYQPLHLELQRMYGDLIKYQNSGKMPAAPKPTQY